MAKKPIQPDITGPMRKITKKAPPPKAKTAPKPIGKPGNAKTPLKPITAIEHKADGSIELTPAAKKMIAAHSPAPVAKPTTPAAEVFREATKPLTRSLSAMVAKAKEASTGKMTQGAPHGVVRARAGTGKTFTLVLAIANMYRHLLDWRHVKSKLGFDPIASEQQAAVWAFIKREEAKAITYAAFNKAIVQEFGTKYRWLVQALQSAGVTLTFSTLHSIGWRATAAKYKLKFGAIDKYKTLSLLERFVQKDIREFRKEEFQLVEAVEALVGYCKINLLHQAGATAEEKLEVDYDVLERTAMHYGVLVPEEKQERIYDLTVKLLNESRDVTEVIDYNDQIWYPTVNGVTVPRADLLLVDEAQDLNRCQQELARLAGNRIVMCGDEAQAIYGFAGADVDSIPNMTRSLGESGRGVESFRLTVTRRCGKKIVEAVQHLVPDFTAHESNPDGSVFRIPRASLMETVGDKDMVLCRVNAPLVAMAFALIRAGRKANIQGRDIGKNMKYMIKISGAKTVSDFIDWLDVYRGKEMEKIMKRRNPNEELIIALNDRVECLLAVAEGAFEIEQLNRNIDKVFQGKQCPSCKKHFDDDNLDCYSCETGNVIQIGYNTVKEKVALVRPEGVLLSSIHRSKGLESKRVFLLHPELLPHPKAKSGWEQEQERNLEYVAKTRAISELYMVVEGDMSDDEE